MGKKLMVLVLGTLLVSMAGAGMGGAADLIGDGRETAFDAGEVNFSFDGANFIVEVAAAAPWCLKDVHIDVQDDPGNFPMVQKNNPKLSAFAYKEDFTFEGMACTSSVSQSFPGFSEGQTVYVAVHAAIVDKTGADPDGDGVIDVDVNEDGFLNADDFTYESAWIDGTPFGGKNWAMYLQATVPAAPAPAP